jgi:rhamnogalacturonan hydrolase
MMLLKSNGGSGALFNAVFRNFTGHSNADTLNIDAYWASKETLPGEGVEYYDIVFQNWAGSCLDGTQRPPIKLTCPPTIPCSLNIEDFNVWSEAGTSQLYKCQNAYGLGACMNQFAGNGAYTTTMTVAVAAAS